MYSLHVQLRSQGPIALDAEFDCQPGELVALLGPSGSGKTSLLRAIAGLLPPAGLHGTVRLGSDVWFDSSRGVHWSPQARRVGLVFQSYALFPHLTAIENIAIGAHSTRASGQKDQKTKAYSHDLMERMGLAGLAQRLPSQLSGGQQQRVALARALVRLRVAPNGSERSAGPGEQGVLLLDEPFSAVDAPTRQTLYRELAALRQHVSTPMVLVTHDLLEARRLADRVVVVDGGTTLQTGTPAKVFGQPRNARVAQLVGIQNLFKGRFVKAEAGWAQLRWMPQGVSDSIDTAPVLHTLDKGRIDDGAEVSWVLAGESLAVTARRPDATPLKGDDSHHANVLDCVLEEALALGETSLCTLKPLGLGADRLTLTLSTAQLRAMETPVGGVLQVHIAPRAIHIMPVRT
jgi:molybdate transport system ATP-binding protein